MNAFQLMPHPQESDLLEVVRPKGKQLDGGTNDSRDVLPEVILRRNDFRSSTKLEALVRHLRASLQLERCGQRMNVVYLGRLQDQDPCFRAVVFSQFTSFMDLIEIVLQREHFDQYRFDGSMDVKKRSASISGFKAPSRNPKVLVVSLKAGGK